MQPVDDVVPQSLTVVDGQPVLWIAGSSCVRHEAVGEEYNPEQMRRVTAFLQGRTDAVLPAWLVVEATDPSAVMIWVLGGKVGYLPRELGQVWAPVLARLRARHGRQIACQATLDPPSQANHNYFGIVVWLPNLLSVQQPPAPAPVPESVRVPPATPPTPASAPQPAPPASAQQVASAVNLEPTPKPKERALSPEALSKLRVEIAEAEAELETARRKLESVEESLEIQSFGFYKPKYGFESSAQYTVRLNGIRDEQQTLIKQDKAAPCNTKWTVGGSASEGKKMVKQQAKLMLRAFNGECDAAIAKVRYDNVTKLEQRLTKAYDDINKLGEVQQVFISRRYFDLKLAELHLVHEHREKVQEEKEEQKRIKEQMREEQKVQEELERAKAEAEKEEAKSAAALEKARAELAAAEATSKQHEKLEALVNKLETQLKDALEQKAKAIARAQLTKSGHVYILSNIGSFGEGIFKIGLTRRLDPYERVEELGDASVPFGFDVHAIIYAEDAPGLEAKLHKEFANRRVNMVNNRKEYFRVSVEEIRAALQKHHGLVSFVLEAEAEEWRKTRAMLEDGADVESSARVQQ